MLAIMTIYGNVLTLLLTNKSQMCSYFGFGRLATMLVDWTNYNFTTKMIGEEAH